MKSDGVDQAKAPRFFYGWVVVAAAFCVALVAYGIQYSFGIFIDPLKDDFGWSGTLVGGAAALFMFSRGALAILTGRITDRLTLGWSIGHGCRFRPTSILLSVSIPMYFSPIRRRPGGVRPD